MFGEHLYISWFFSCRCGLLNQWVLFLEVRRLHHCNNRLRITIRIVVIVRILNLDSRRWENGMYHHGVCVCRYPCTASGKNKWYYGQVIVVLVSMIIYDSIPHILYRIIALLWTLCKICIRKTSPLLIHGWIRNFNELDSMTTLDFW